MSTKAIRALARLCKDEAYQPEIEKMADEALRELETIERAAKVIGSWPGVVLVDIAHRESNAEAHELMVSIAKEAQSGLTFSADVPVEVTVLPRKQRKDDKETP